MSLRPRAVAAPRPDIKGHLQVSGRVLAAARRLNWGLLAITLGGSLFVAYYTVRVNQWTVMSDELQYSKLALNIGNTLSPVPNIRGGYTGSLAQLYPILIAPLMHAFAMPTAFRAVHVLNAILMASTAIPAYLLTRELVRSKTAAYLVAVLTISIPWMVMSTMMLTEVAAYPAFVWAILALQRSLARPSAQRDLLALGALVLAFLGRTQFLILVPIFAATLVLHEAGWALTRRPFRPLAGLRDGVVNVIRQHRVLAWAGALGGVATVLATLTGTLGKSLGRYQPTIEGGNFLPHGVLHATALHVDFVAVAIGVLPFVLTAAWAFSTLGRPSTKQGHAFAVLTILTVTAIAFQAASFNLRFAIGGPIQDRYLFYVVPMLFVGMMACLLDEPPRSYSLLAVGGAFAWLVSLASFRPTGLPFFATPDSVWFPALNGRSWQIGRLVGADITATPLIRLVTIVCCIGIAIALRRLPRRLIVWAVAIPVFAYTAVETGYVFEKVEPAINQGLPTSLVGKNWIDEAVPGTGVGAVVGPVNANWDGAPRAFGPGGVEASWQDAEFWNKAIERVYLYQGYGGYAPFRNQPFVVDRRTGRVSLAEVPPVIVMSASDVRFGLAATWSNVYATGFMLLRPAKPYRLDWVTRNIRADGWTKGGVPVRLRIYPAESGRSARRRVEVIFQSSGEVRHARQVYLRLAGTTYSGALKVGKRRTLVVNACVPGSRSLDGSITATTPVRHKPPLGMRITRIRVSGPGSSCTPA